LLEQLGALGLAAARVDEDGYVCGANDPFLQLTGASADRLTGIGLNEFLESAAAEHKSYGDGVVYRFAGRKGDKWLRPKRGRAHRHRASSFSLTSPSEWSMLAKLVSSIDVRDRLMRDADIGMFRYNPGRSRHSISRTRW
jgi:PAS domain-containing protein